MKPFRSNFGHRHASTLITNALFWLVRKTNY